MSDNNELAINVTTNSDGNEIDFEVEETPLTQEEVDIQIKTHLAFLSQQLAGLTKLIPF